MAQTRKWNYLADDKTSDINRWLTGLFSNGVYYGFDFAPSANMTLTLNHNTTGFKDINKDLVESNFQSLIVTRQGVVIKEDAAIVLPGIAVGDVTNPRIDIVIITHQITEISGGSQGLYSVIQGSPAGSPVAPALTDTTRQTKIGELYIPANTVALNGVGVTWTRNKKPLFAGALFTAGRVLVTDTDGMPIVSSITSTILNFLSGLSVNVQTGKQDTITGAATTITSANLTASRALVSDGSGKVIVSVVTSTELGYLAGVTSAIQTQLNSLAITGAATTIQSANLTVNRALASDGSGKVIVSVVTSTELGYLAGVTSAIQTQINSKQDIITGGATTILSANLTASRALVSDGSGKVIVSAVTSTELGYLAGVTSAIQTQINNLDGTNIAWTTTGIVTAGSWSLNPTYGTGIRKVGGRLEMRGYANNGAGANCGDIMFTLPVGYRPIYTLRLPVGPPSVTVNHFIDIDSTGAVYVYEFGILVGNPMTDSTCWLNIPAIDITH